MKVVMSAIILSLLCLPGANDASAIFMEFPATAAGYDPATAQDDEGYAAVQCLPSTNSGRLCFIPDFTLAWTGYNLCHNGVYIGNGLGDKDIQFFKTPKLNTYVLYFDSTGTAGGGSHFLVYLADEGMLFYTELFKYIDAIVDKNLKFEVHENNLEITFFRDGKKFTTVQFDGKKISSSNKSKILSDSDFIDLNKNLVSNEGLKKLLLECEALNDKDSSTIFSGEIFRKKLTSQLNDNDVNTVINKINSVKFSTLKDKDDYFTIESSSLDESDSSQETLDKQVIVTINKLSGVIEIAWLERKKRQRSESY
ncbi:MAG: hypothetical protein HQK81_12750 [Desulfovibrionaceae bacterium]|nr:hypothetical protein [Desulfovibrionaceae bacterium]MBF0514913.1 hypothetical protein [Desulfovibrionaceae bacterium]